MEPRVEVTQSEYLRVLEDPTDPYYGLMNLMMVTPEKRRANGWYIMDVKNEDEFYAKLNLPVAIALDAATEVEVENYAWFIDLTDAQWLQATPTELTRSIKYDESDPPVASQMTWQEWADHHGWTAKAHDGNMLIGNIGTKFDLKLAATLSGLGFTLKSDPEAKTIYAQI